MDETIAALVAELTPGEQRAIALLGLMIRWHGGRDGDGLFTGPGRYEVLAGRVRETATMSRSVRAFWDRVTRRMRWSVGPVSSDGEILALIGPADTDPDTLVARPRATRCSTATRCWRPGPGSPSS